LVGGDVRGGEAVAMGAKRPTPKGAGWAGGGVGVFGGGGGVWGGGVVEGGGGWFGCWG
jgi:hypothetical protein